MEPALSLKLRRLTNIRNSLRQISQAWDSIRPYAAISTDAKVFSFNIQPQAYSFCSFYVRLRLTVQRVLPNNRRAKQPPHPTLATIDIDAAKVWPLAVSPDGSRIAVGGQRGFFRVLDLTTGKQIAELHGNHPATVDCLEFSLDGQFLATGSWRNNEVIVWRAADGAMQNLSKQKDTSERSPFRRTERKSLPDAKTSCFLSRTRNPVI